MFWRSVSLINESTFELAQTDGCQSGVFFLRMFEDQNVSTALVPVPLEVVADNPVLASVAVSRFRSHRRLPCARDGAGREFRSGFTFVRNSRAPHITADFPKSPAPLLPPYHAPIIHDQ